MRKLYVAGLLLGLVAWAPAQPGLGGIQWTHDLSVEQITLQYPGANASATARAYAIEPNTDVDILVTVKNRSSNPSRAYRIDLRAGGQSIGSLNGPSVPAQGEKLLSLKWKPAQAGPGEVEARLSFTSNSGGSKAPCADCRSSRTGGTSISSTRTRDTRCSYPNSCSVGSMGSPCSCHPSEDDPRNNTSRAAYQVGGEGANAPAQPTTSDGIDLQVDSCYVQASVAKMGTYDAFVTISNQGNRAHTGAIDVEVSVGSMTRTLTFRGGLKPGEVKTETIEFTKSGRAKAVVDPKNTIKEAREDNNSNR